MPKYLGETPVESLRDTPFEGFWPADWAMEYISRYGQIDGEHHKTWVIDQVARILKGTSVTVKLARWDDGQFEYRINTGTPSEEYMAWVEEMLGEYDDEAEEYEYGYDAGIGP